MEDFVTYEQAIKLKELGFDWKCNHWYNFLKELKTTGDYYSGNQWSFQKTPAHADAPTLSQAQKWIYEKFGIWVDPTWSIIEHKFRWVARWIGPLCNGYNQEISNIIFDNPFEALSSGLDRVLEILKM